MLGRLFKQEPQTIPIQAQPPLDSSFVASSSSTSSFDDLFTREILYGTRANIKAAPLHNKLFRIIIAQDGGSLRLKQVLFDSANETKNITSPNTYLNDNNNNNNTITNGNLYGVSTTSYRAMLSSKIHHNTGDLCDYMFGCGLPTSEQQLTTKIHILPELLSGSSARLVLITRLFLISDGEEMYKGFYNSNKFIIGQSDPTWRPQSALPIKETSLWSLKASNRIKEGNVSSRFSIGIIVPIDDLSESMTDILITNWNEISHYLIILQKLVVKKLTTILEANPNYIVNLRIQLPQFILQTETDIHAYVVKLVRLIFYDAGTARLINTNDIMRFPDTIFKTKQLAALSNITVNNWVSEVLNWLEFKEGRMGQTIQTANNNNPSPSFLASLIALILPLRDALSSRPLSLLQGNTSRREVCRIVVMTGNPLVAKKLIFILNGLIPGASHQYLIVKTPDLSVKAGSISNLSSTNGGGSGSSFNNHGNSSNSSLVNGNQGSIKSNSSSINGTNVFNQTTSMEFAPTSPRRKPFIIPEDEWFDDSTLVPSSPSTMRGVDVPEQLVKPIPIRQKSESNSPDSFGSFGGIRGWEIPTKSSSTIRTPELDTSRVIPIVQQVPIHKNSVSGINSNAVVNSGVSIHGTLSKSSSMAYLSLSLNLSLLSSTLNYSLLKLSGSFMEKWKSSFGSNVTPDFSNGSIKRMSSFRSPLPAIEHDEFSWSTPNKLNKAQLMLDMQGSLPKSRRNVNNSCIPLENHRVRGANIRRTRVSVFHGSAIEGGEEVNNLAIISRKCRTIFDTKPAYSKKSLTTLNVALPNNGWNEGKLIERSALGTNVAFSEEFRPEFSLQLCPVSPRLESLVLNAMKNDLLFFQNNCEVENVTSKTIFISLRVREIKVIEMKVGESSNGNGMTNLNVISSNGSSSGDLGNQYKTTILKTFTGQRTNGNEERIAEVEEILRQLNTLYSLRLTEEMQRGFNELMNLR